MVYAYLRLCAVWRAYLDSLMQYLSITLRSLNHEYACQRMIQTTALYPGGSSLCQLLAYNSNESSPFTNLQDKQQTHMLHLCDSLNSSLIIIRFLIPVALTCNFQGYWMEYYASWYAEHNKYWVELYSNAWFCTKLYLILFLSYW